MKQWFVGSALLVGIVLLLGATYAAFSQDPRGDLNRGQQVGAMRRGMQQGMPPRNPMKAGTQGLFFLQGTTLLKFSSTLQAQGKLDLSDASAKGRPQPGALLLAGDDVLVVTGSTFYRVDGKTLTVSVKKALPDVAKTTQTTQAANGQHQPPQPPMAPPELELNNRTLYLLRGPSLVALSIDDGSVLGQATLQKPANAPQMDGGPMDGGPMGAPPAPPQ